MVTQLIADTVAEVDSAVKADLAAIVLTLATAEIPVTLVIPATVPQVIPVTVVILLPVLVAIQVRVGIRVIPVIAHPVIVVDLVIVDFQEQEHLVTAAKVLRVTLDIQVSQVTAGTLVLVFQVTRAIVENLFQDTLVIRGNPFQVIPVTQGALATVDFQD